MTKRIVHFNIYYPNNSILGKKSYKAECQTVECELSDCPLKKKGQCIATKFFGKCEYGRKIIETGYTPKARKYYSWIQEKKEKYKDIPYLKSPPNKLVYIGKYVYLPYPHMNMCKNVNFKAHGGPLLTGSNFLEKVYWNPKTIDTLISFRPHSLIGDEITRYQKEIVPLFMQHLREVDKQLWDEVVKLRPQFDNQPNYLGRTALLRTLNFPIKIPAKNQNYPVYWKWDGKVLTTHNEHAYNTTWGGFSKGNIELKMIPDPNEIVEVSDNSWVNKETEFVD